MSNSPQRTALGGINISNLSDDASMAFRAPGLLRSSMNGQINASFNRLYGINAMFFSYAYHHTKTGITFSAAVDFFDYGKIIETDPSGNVIGTVRPADYVMQLSAAMPYLQKWNFGASVKYINSNYGSYRANGVAFDFGVLYKDTARLINVGINVVNVGTQLRTYNGAGKEELPFDVQLGVTKRLKYAPLSFSLTMHHLHRFHITYDGDIFNDDIIHRSFTEKLLSHVILAAQAHPIKQVELTVGYNFLQRKELSISNTANGLTGFSIGAGALFRQLQFRYGRSFFQNNSSNNQIGISFWVRD